MSIFISEDLVEVKIRYAQLGPNDLVIVKTEEEEEFYKGKVEVRTVKAKFERPGWQVFNEYMDEAVMDSNTFLGSPSINTTRLKRDKFKSLISYLEDDGEVINLQTPGLEKILIPDIPLALISAYDEFLQEERIGILKDKGILNDFDQEKKEDDSSEEVAGEEDEVDKEEKASE